MACFIVPGTEAVVTTIVTKIVEKREKKAEVNSNDINMHLDKEKLSTSLKRLNGLLWGGTALLAFEHLWHGEIVPFFPFLTAANDPGQLAEVTNEMATVGVGMAVLVTAVWAVSTKIIAMAKKSNAEETVVSKM